jgi:dTDP-4-dehydrorhamnose 3,5-epimerase
VNRFDIQNTALRGLRIIERKRVHDERGFLSRLFCADELAAAGWRAPVAQINHTHTVQRGTVRGLHFQSPPHAEAKIVSCLAGEVWDVAVDIRRGSPTFLRWHAEHLSAENLRALLIPQGFAHGYQALSADCQLIYVHSAPYSQVAQGALNPTDPRLAISWPLEITAISERDRSHPLLTPDYQGVAE